MPRPDLGNLAGEVRAAEQHLNELAAVRAAFAEYADDLRSIADKGAGKRPFDAARDTQVRPLLALADDKRRAFKNRLAAFNPNAPNRTDFQPLVQPNLRTEPENFVQVMTELRSPGVVIGSRPVISRNALEAALAEAEDYLEQAHHALAADLALKQARLGALKQSTTRVASTPAAPAVQPSLTAVAKLSGALIAKWWQWLKGTGPFRLVFWAFEDWFKRLVSAGLIAAAVWLWTRLSR